MSGRGKDLSDMSMLELFRLETENYCAAISDDLLTLEQDPGAAEALASLMRAAHSIKGAARIVDLGEVVRLAHAMEDVFVAAQAGRVTLVQDHIDQLLRGVDLLSEIGRAPAGGLPDWLAGQGPEIDRLVAAFETISKGGEPPGEQPGGRAAAAPTGKKEAPEPSSSGKTGSLAEAGLTAELRDMSMLELFRLETENYCAAISDDLLALEQDPGAAEALASLMRAAHSIKGAARIVDLGMVVGLAHAMEDVFVAAQAGRVTLVQDHIDQLLRGVDLLSEMTRQEDSVLDEWLAGRETEISALVDTYKAVASDGSVKGGPSPPPAAPVAKVPAREPKPPPAAAGNDDAADRALRVSAEGMNRLMGLAGEVQVEARWLPAFSLKMLRLKHRQDEVYRLLDRQGDFLDVAPAGDADRSGFRNLLARMDHCRNLVNENLAEIEDHARRATEISHRLYLEVIANRMRPFSEGVRGFPRMVRDLARELGKKVQLEIVGAETMVDRDILDKIESPLNHLVRNAIDHGIEFPQERVRAGKPEKAVIRLEARHSAGMLNIVVSDDGCGIDLEKLRRTVVKKKMVAEEMARDLGETELLDFLFLPNFSTRDEVSKVSGRGVGLDVVHSAVHEVRGIVRTSTRPGAGTTFELQLPLTLSVMRSLLVDIAGEAYAFPLVAIDHVVTLPEQEIKEVEGRQYVTFNGERIGLVSARQVLEKGEKDPDDSPEDLLILVVSDRHNQYGLIVDRFLGIRDLVVQALDRRLKKVQDISAAAILEDGTPVLIVDVEDMVRSIDCLISGNRLRRIGHEDLVVGRQAKRVLVVDDSITVREVERKMLSARGYDVVVAVDGMDAWNAVRNNVFDLVVTDVDMPRMDGIELVGQIRNDSRFEMLPVIIVSYKDREEDRRRGLEVGADYYLTKGSFQDETLVKAVEELIGGPDKG